MYPNSIVCLKVVTYCPLNLYTQNFYWENWDTTQTVNHVCTFWVKFREWLFQDNRLFPWRNMSTIGIFLASVQVQKNKKLRSMCLPEQIPEWQSTIHQWSEISRKQKRPYDEVAHKLADMHEQHFSITDNYTDDNNRRIMSI